MEYHFCDQLTADQASAWGAFLETSGHGHLRQHPAWVRVSGKTRRGLYWYFWGEEGGQIRVTALVRRLVLPALGWAQDWVERGPVCDDPDLLMESTGRLCGHLQRTGGVDLIVNPYWWAPDVERVEAGLSSLGFAPWGRPGGPHDHTLVIDLTPAEEEIRMSFRKAIRHALRRAEELGLEVTPARDEQDMDAFWLAFRQMAEQKHIGALENEYLMRLWHELLSDQSRGLCLIARYQGEVVAGNIVLRHGHRVEELHSPSLPGKFSDVPKKHLCVWEAIRWARAQGCTIYDLAGYTPDAAEGSALAGINQFKMGFSKTAVTLVREHRYIADPGRTDILLRILWLRSRLLKRHA